MDTKRHRDLAIDAAIHALMRLRAPAISNAEIQKRGRTESGTGYYTALLDDIPIVTVTLHTDERVTLTLCPPVSG